MSLKQILKPLTSNLFKNSQNEENSKNKGDTLQYKDIASGIFDNKSEDTDDVCKSGKVVNF